MHDEQLGQAQKLGHQEEEDEEREAAQERPDDLSQDVAVDRLQSKSAFNKRCDG
jgi:hypothetical protein